MPDLSVAQITGLIGIIQVIAPYKSPWAEWHAGQGFLLCARIWSIRAPKIAVVPPDGLFLLLAP